jgi:NAD(P)-dependent dehydrogenase (short-subunit alcohol dehydrogenase family)
MRKVAFVSGGTRGIGRACAAALKNEGYNVIVSASTSLPDDGEFDYIRCDISKTEDRLAAIDYVCSKYGRLDVLVNCAGVACKQRLDILETTEESFDRLMSINTKGTFFMCQMFSNKMVQWKQEAADDYIPRIINIGSISAYTSSVSRGEYCISKAGVSMITALFADRLAEYGIPVFEVRPGIIRTDMTATVTAKYDKLIAEGITPIKRWGEGADVAKCVLAAASGLLDFGTGTILNADGGFHLRRL